MPRYLTPSRLCLLILIDLYSSGETASSAQLNILDFIARRILTPDPKSHYSIHVDPASDPATTDALALSNPLAQWASDIPGRSVFDSLLQRLWHLRGLDSLHVFLEHLVGLISSPIANENETIVRFSYTSPVGQFIRRCDVEFTRLQFNGTQALWTALATYRAPTYKMWAQKNPEVANGLLDVDLTSSMGIFTDTDCTSGPEAFTSTKDIDQLVSFSNQQLQKFGTRLPDDIKSKLKEWITDQSDSNVKSLKHFVACFEHWRAGQYTMALESLHRYFDYSMIGKNGPNNMRQYYQYALLHLSALHADFDCWEESFSAMDECIATARENQDLICLNFALSWLLYPRRVNPGHRPSAFVAVRNIVGGGGSRKDGLAFLKAKAKETKHWSLMSGTLIEEAKLELHHNGNARRSFAHIVQSAYVNMQHDLRTLIPTTTLVQGAYFDRLSQTHLSNRINESVMLVHSLQCAKSDRVRAVCRMAIGLTRSGLYNAAMKVLGEVTPEIQGVLKFEQRIMGFATLVQLTRKVRCNDLQTAREYLAQLQKLREHGDTELAFEVSLVEVDLLMRRQELEQAMEIIGAHLKRLKNASGPDIAQRLRFLILKTRVFAASGRPMKGFSVALRAVSKTARVGAVSVFFEAIAALAVILNEINEFAAARGLIESIAPLVIESRHTSLAARLFVNLAETYVGTAGHAHLPGSSEQFQSMRLAEDYVECGRELYARIEDLSGMLDCLAMKARLMRWRGDEESATQTDDLYLQLLADRTFDDATR